VLILRDLLAGRRYARILQGLRRKGRAGPEIRMGSSRRGRNVCAGQARLRSTFPIAVRGSCAIVRKQSERRGGGFRGRNFFDGV